MGKTTQRRLVDDVVSGRWELTALAKRYGMRAEVLAQWARGRQIQETLRGLCVLGDLQTQLLLSRYRLVAAGKLIKLATQEEEGREEVARKACVDLLKLGQRLEEVEETEGPQAGSLRELLYGESGTGGAQEADEGAGSEEGAKGAP